jgi:hypothetical protein
MTKKTDDIHYLRLKQAIKNLNNACIDVGSCAEFFKVYSQQEDINRRWELFLKELSEKVDNDFLSCFFSQVTPTKGSDTEVLAVLYCFVPNYSKLFNGIVDQHRDEWAPIFEKFFPEFNGLIFKQSEGKEWKQCVKEEE